MTRVQPGVLPYLKRVGIAFDRLVNASLLFGDEDETVSEHAAEANADRITWGCWLCWVLGKIVQPHHCRDVREVAYVAPTYVYFTAAVAFVAFFAAVGCTMAEIVRWL